MSTIWYLATIDPNPETDEFCKSYDPFIKCNVYLFFAFVKALINVNSYGFTLIYRSSRIIAYRKSNCTAITLCKPNLFYELIYSFADKNIGHPLHSDVILKTLYIFLHLNKKIPTQLQNP